MTNFTLSHEHKDPTSFVTTEYRQKAGYYSEQLTRGQEEYQQYMDNADSSNPDGKTFYESFCTPQDVEKIAKLKQALIESVEIVQRINARQQLSLDTLETGVREALQPVMAMLSDDYRSVIKTTQTN